MRVIDFFGKEEKILSLEFFPPKNEDKLDDALSLIRELKSFQPHFMTVTYGAGGGTRLLTRKMVSYIHKELCVPAVAHQTCVNHSASEIDDMLSALSFEGIENVLALRGDPPKGESKFVKHPEGFSCARDLIGHITKRGEFCILAAGYPETHLEAVSPEQDIAYLREKVDAGAQAILTQLFFDASVYFDFIERTAKAGIKVPIVPGIMPIGSLSQVERFTSLCGASIPLKVREQLKSLKNDPEGIVQFGIEYAVRQAEELLSEGAPGIHLYTLNKSLQTAPILGALNIGRKEK